MSKIKILFTGQNLNIEVVKLFMEELMTHGENHIEFVQNSGNEDLHVDISDLSPTDNLTHEAFSVIQDCLGIKKYKRKQTALFKKALHETKRELGLNTKVKRININ